MNLYKKYQAQLIATSLVLVFLVTRLYHILAVPIFTDESIYIRWTQIFRGDIHQVFVSLTDGKQPLFIWIGSAFLHLAHNPLLAVRLVSVGAGLLTMLGLYLLTKELFEDKRTAVVASLLYIVYPFALVYDKLALYDGMLATFAVWSLYLEVLLVKRKKLLIAATATVVIGGALLTKSSAFFYLYLLPFSLLLLNFKSKTRNKDFVKWLCLAIFVVLGALACYAILKFSPNFQYIASKNTVFVYPVGEWLKHPFKFFESNLHYLGSSLVAYATVPLLFLAGIAVVLNRKYTREKLLLLLWFVVPFGALVFFGKLLYPRYIFFMTMPLLVLAALSIMFLARKVKPVYLKVFIVALVLLPMLVKDYFLLTDFARAPIPQADHYQLISGYASGVGVPETVRFLMDRAKSDKIYVGTEGTFGLMPDALQDYFSNNRNVQIKGVWPVTDTIPPEVLAAAQTMPTYFVFYAPCPVCQPRDAAPKSWPVRPVFSITRLDKSLYTLYQVVPPKSK